MLVFRSFIKITSLIGIKTIFVSLTLSLMVFIFLSIGGNVFSFRLLTIAYTVGIFAALEYINLLYHVLTAGIIYYYSKTRKIPYKFLEDAVFINNLDIKHAITNWVNAF